MDRANVLASHFFTFIKVGSLKSCPRSFLIPPSFILVWFLSYEYEMYLVVLVLSVTPCININFQQVFKCLPWYSDTHKEVNNPEKCPWKEPSWHRHHQLLCKIQWKCCQASKLAILLNDAKKMWWVVWKIFLGSKSLLLACLQAM